MPRKELRRNAAACKSWACFCPPSTTRCLPFVAPARGTYYYEPSSSALGVPSLHIRSCWCQAVGAPLKQLAGVCPRVLRAAGLQVAAACIRRFVGHPLQQSLALILHRHLGAWDWICKSMHLWGHGQQTTQGQAACLLPDCVLCCRFSHNFACRHPRADACLCRRLDPDSMESTPAPDSGTAVVNNSLTWRCDPLHHSAPAVAAANISAQWQQSDPCNVHIAAACRQCCCLSCVAQCVLVWP